MITSNYTVQIIEPSDGMMLTQSADVEIKDRIFSNKVFLAVTDSVDNWKEVTIEYANEVQAEQERLAKEEAEKNN